MTYKVIAEFIDRRNGARVLAGAPVPEGMEKDQIKRLVKAGCLEVVMENFRKDGEKPSDGKKSATEEKKPKAETKPADGKSPAGTKAVAGANGNTDSNGSKPKK